MGVATRYKVTGWSGAGGMAEGTTPPEHSATRFALHFCRVGLIFGPPMTPPDNAPESLPTYRWPYFLGAFVLLGIVLGIMWTLWSIRMTTDQRKEREALDSFGHPKMQTNEVAQ